MKCDELFDVIPQLLSGKLDRETEKRAYEHLMNCADCRKELAFWSNLQHEVVLEKMPHNRKLKVYELLFPAESNALDLTISAVKVMFKMIKVAF